ncbi:hypothetical protein ACFL3G_06480 [Planctomycetota bacterium]
MSEMESDTQKQGPKASKLAMKIISVLHTSYIGVISIMLVFSTLRASLKFIFATDMYYTIHIVVGVFVAVIGLFVIIAQIKKVAYVGFVQILWWTPQLITVVIKEFDAEFSRYVLYSLYHWPMGLRFSVELGWDLSSHKLLFVQLNIVAVLGIIIATITKHYIRDKQ